MSEDNGGAAFPWCGDLNECPCINLGMTLRDYFAAQAMNGLCSGAGSFRASEMAVDAYGIADAMLEAKNK